jgi:hypothetical protein
LTAEAKGRARDVAKAASQLKEAELMKKERVEGEGKRVRIEMDMYIYMYTCIYIHKDM